MKCLNCGKDIKQTKGKRAKLYCSNSCRMSYKRTKTITEQSLTNKTINEQPLTNTPKIDVKNMTNEEAVAILKAWAAGKRTEWQRRLGVLAKQWDIQLDAAHSDQLKLPKGVCRYCGDKIDDRLVCCGPCAWGKNDQANKGKEVITVG